MNSFEVWGDMTILYKMSQKLFPFKNINMLKIPSSIHLYYNGKMTYIHRMSFPIIDLCFKKIRMELSYISCYAVYVILYSLFAQGIVTDDLELPSEALKFTWPKCDFALLC